MSKSPSHEVSLPRWLIIGFSGHRHLGADLEWTSAAIREQIDQLRARYSRIAGVCSAASGADTLFGEAMLDAQAPLTVILPFPIERFKRDFDGDSPGVWARAEQIIRGASELDVVHQLDADTAAVFDPLLPAAEQTQRLKQRNERAYWEATLRTVHRADITLVVWNEQPGKGRGGTADAVDYADKLGKPLIILNPQTRQVTKRRIPPKFTGDFSSPIDGSDYRRLVERGFGELDQAASDHGPEARRLMKKYVMLHLLGSIGAAFAVVFEGSLGPWLLLPAGAEILFIIPAIMLMKSRGAHYKEWLVNRVKAEICRSFLRTWDIRRHASLSHEPRQPIPIYPELFRELRFIRTLDRSPSPPVEQVREVYLKDRIEHQLEHFRSRRRSAANAVRIYQPGAKFCTIAALTAATTAFIFISLGVLHVVEIRDVLVHLLEFLGIVLPLGASAFGFLMVTEEASRRSHRYEQMQSAMERLKPVVEAAPTWDALSRAATQVEEELLQELVEWQAFVINTEHRH